MSVREQVNRMLFGGQHEAIIEWIENLKKELEEIPMPEQRYYTVTQEREVKVWANRPVDAAVIAAAKFGDREKPHGVVGEVRTPVRDRDLNVREDI